MNQLSDALVLFISALGDWLIVILFVVTVGLMAWVVQWVSEYMALGAIYQAIREGKVQP